MTKDRVDEIELELLRAAVQGPLDGRQKVVSLGLELVKAVHREREVRDSATLWSTIRLAWYTSAWALLKEAVELLERPTAQIGGAAWTADAQRFLRRFKDTNAQPQ